MFLKSKKKYILQDVTEDELKRIFDNVKEKIDPKDAKQTTLEIVNKYVNLMFSLYIYIYIYILSRSEKYK